MHGCPSGEIEKIGAYLISEKGLHTTIKLNPTLLGKEDLHAILRNSGFETEVPDLAFTHDLKYPEALRIIRNLKKLSGEKQLFFGLKLTNTLESRNHKEIFPPNEEMMYMSGRALHPVSVNLARKLQNEFNGKLDISFSGGADVFNTPDLIACGKGISSSLPIAAVIGREDVMNIYAPGSMTSTHSGSPLPVASAVANLRVLKDEKPPRAPGHLWLKD